MAQPNAVIAWWGLLEDCLEPAQPGTFLSGWPAWKNLQRKQQQWRLVPWRGDSWATLTVYTGAQNLTDWNNSRLCGVSPMTTRQPGDWWWGIVSMMGGGALQQRPIYWTPIIAYESAVSFFQYIHCFLPSRHGSESNRGDGYQRAG